MVRLVGSGKGRKSKAVTSRPLRSKSIRIHVPPTTPYRCCAS